jgi:hypothetical protein
MREEDLKTCWQQQPAEALPITLEQLRLKAAVFQKRILRQDLVEYVGCAFVVLGFGFYAWLFPNILVKAGSLMIVVASVFIAYQLHRRGASRSIPLDGMSTQLLEFHRRQLTRRRDFFRTSWVWYLSPFVPGIVVFDLGMSQMRPDKTLSLIFMAVFVSTFFAVGLLNEWRARRLQKQIDALSAMSSTTPPSGLRETGN